MFYRSSVNNPRQGQFGPSVNFPLTDVGKFTYKGRMEQFMHQVRTYASALNIHPSTVIQRAARVGGNSWPKWESGKSSPTLKTADKILKYIADNPAPASDAGATPLKAVG